MRGPLLLHHPVTIAPGAPVLEVAGVVRSSAVDGPGNRYVLFLQGCNFDCTACHNPTTIGRCDACGACVPVCPHGALSLPEPGVVAYDPAPCDRCKLCVTVCPIDADPAIRVVPVDVLVEEIRPLARFLSGVTVTGGEPTIQAGALAALFAALKADAGLGHLTTLVDTNGTLPPARWKPLLPVLDGAMVDLKAASSDLHQRLTGHDNVAVKETIRFLSSAGKLAEVRLLVVEGVTDTDEELAAWAEFVAAVDPGIPVRLMAFRHTGTRERARIWPETSPEAVDRVQERLTALGLTAVGSIGVSRR
ncbi:MAG: YjjW family glycine radical enzyme activase [Acidimicrobiia bacterium]|nr:YjjW family glycine radical enzyme activase [Acidimicrobiia bacterium]